MSNQLNVLTKTDKDTSCPPQLDLENKSITEEDFFDCTHLIKRLNDENFSPPSWVTAFKEHIKKHPRIFYSKISLYIYEIAQTEDTDRILTNLNNAIYAIEKEEHEKIDFKKIALKLYDHINLAIQQKLFIHRKNDSVLQDVEVTAQQALKSFEANIDGQIKHLERNYITILGIFAAIVITFTAGSIFSSSVLENMHKVSAYRAIFTIVSIGFVLVNTLFALFYFLKKTTSSSQKNWPYGFIWITNLFCIFILLAVFCSWRSGLIEARNEEILTVEPKSSCPQPVTCTEMLKRTCSLCR